MIILTILKFLLFFIGSLLWVLVVGFFLVATDKKESVDNQISAEKYTIILAVVVTILWFIVYYIEKLQKSVGSF